MPDIGLGPAHAVLQQQGRVGGSASVTSQMHRLVRDVLLRDGSTLRLQASTPGDVQDIKAFYDGLSPESRYFRFHGFGRTDVVARTEAEASGVDRLALIGRHDGQVVSVASYDGLRETGVAEIALAVADQYQRRGIGTRMLEQLAAIGAGRAIHRFDAEVMRENRPMLGVFEGVGFAVRREGSLGELTISLDITPNEAVIERIDARDHVAAIASLQPILAPASVAVVGAVAAPGNVGCRLLANIIASGFAGVVGAVNGEGSVVCSVRAARSIEELAFVPELVVIADSGDTLEFAAQAAAAGAAALVVAPAGPQERGTPDRQERLLEIVRDAGMRLVGPNSLGVLNTAHSVALNATFSGAAVSAGGLAICSQSGAPGIGLLGHAAARQLGISILVSTGTGADVSTNDLLEWCEEDARTGAVMLYVETFGNPEHFTRIAQRLSREKPILALKGRRRTELGRRRAQSHTAEALRGDTVIDALLRQAGVLRFRAVEALLDAAMFFESQPLPRGRRVAIVSNSSGLATLAADACVTRGLELSPATAVENPIVVDITGGADEYAAIVRERLDDPGTDGLIVLYVDLFDDPEAVLAAISAASAGRAKPVVASVVRSDGRLPARAGSRVPNFLFVESCADVLARGAERREWLSRPLGEPPQYPDLDKGAAGAVITSFLDRHPTGGWLSGIEAQTLLATHGIPVAASHRCHSLEQAIAVAARSAAPVAMKADLHAPAQAGDIDAVLLGLEGEAAIRSGWRELTQRVQTTGHEWNGAILQPLAPGGADVLVGAIVDADLGVVLATGLGGTQAGLDQTVAFRLPPKTDTEADELIDASEAVTAELDGFRGGPMLDRTALRKLILRFALLLGNGPEIIEADLNPVRCTTEGCVVLDLHVRVERPRPVDRVKTW
jgi:acyl-CoA synthetase (NDP forming)/RimJ/RimL family protein N-acetyltransferase